MSMLFDGINQELVYTVPFASGQGTVMLRWRASGDWDTWNNIVQLNSTDGAQVQLFLSGDGTTLRLWSGNLGISGGNTTMQQWYHLALVNNGTVTQVYINGVLDISSPYLAFWEQLRLGRSSFNDQSNGAICDVLAYDTVYTARQVKNQAKFRRPLSTVGMLLWVPAIETGTRRTVDYSNFNRAPTLNGTLNDYSSPKVSWGAGGPPAAPNNIPKLQPETLSLNHTLTSPFSGGSIYSETLSFGQSVGMSGGGGTGQHASLPIQYSLSDELRATLRTQQVLAASILLQVQLNRARVVDLLLDAFTSTHTVSAASRGELRTELSLAAAQSTDLNAVRDVATSLALGLTHTYIFAVEVDLGSVEVELTFAHVADLQTSPAAQIAQAFTLALTLTEVQVDALAIPAAVTLQVTLTTDEIGQMRAVGEVAFASEQLTEIAVKANATDDLALAALQVIWQGSVQAVTAVLIEQLGWGFTTRGVSFATSITTPDCRKITVAGESRLLEIPLEVRSMEVEPESRYMEVEPESRYMEVEPEDRRMEVAC